MNYENNPGDDDKLKGARNGTPPDADQSNPEEPGPNSEGTEIPNSNGTETGDYSSADAPPRRKTAVEVASGLGIAALVYALLWAAFASQVGIIIVVLSLALLGGGVVWSVKLMRSGRTAMGVTMLAAFALPLLALLTVGACVLLFIPFSG